MIISHKYRYLFVEVPRTGSTAISAELVEHYDGEAILYKHAYYSTFLEHATPEERNYRVLAGIRNPLDDTVSVYKKYTTKERSYYAGNKRNLRKFDYINQNSLTFSDYLRKFHKLPYDHWTSTYHTDFEHIIRFENLRDDFAKALIGLGIEPVRPLPRKNATKRDPNFESYYGPDDVPFAARIFGPYMQSWNYDFPESWKDISVPVTARMLFRLLRGPRKIYWNYVRQHGSFLGRTFRRTILDE